MGNIRYNGIIKYSTEMVEHDAGYHSGDALYVGESYTNQIGTRDNYMEAATSNGTVTDTAATAEFVLQSGIGVAGYAKLRTESTKVSVLGPKPTTASFRVRNVINGAGADRHTVLGLCESASTVPLTAGSSGCYFHQLADDTWLARSNNQGVDDDNSASVLTIADDDILSVVATNAKAWFYQNGNLVLETKVVDQIPTVALGASVGVIATAATVSTARGISIRSIQYMRYF